MTLEREIECPDCGGTGREMLPCDATETLCEFCRGAGVVRVPMPEPTPDVPLKLAITGEYPKDWHIIAKHVKDEACLQCVRCKTPHNPRIGRCLTVHHFDGDKGNCERWNLMALCQACHLSIQGRVDPRTPILFPPSPWSMPYIAGAYAAGTCTPPPGFDLAEWIAVYHCNIGDWPAWAVRTIPVRDGEPTNG